MPRWITGVGTLFIVTLILTGCGSDPGFSEEEFRAGEGSVQFVNMMPDSPQVRMFHGLSQTDVAFPFTSSIEVRFVDRYDWDIAYINAANDRITVAEGENQQISEDVLTTFLFMGNTTQPNIQIIDTPTIAQADRIEGEADVWIASNSTIFDMVDIYLVDADADIANEAPLVTVTSGTFTQLFTVPSGTARRLWVTNAGTGEVLFDSGSIEILDRRQELFALVDDFGPDGNNHVDVIRTFAQSQSVVRDFSQEAAIRAGNYSTLASINVTIGEAQFTGVEADTLSAYQTLESGTVGAVVEAEGSIREETETELFQGLSQSLLTFTDTDNAGQTRSVTTLDSFRPVTARSLFKFVNGSNQNVDMYALRDGQETDEVPPLLSDLEFGGTTTTESFSENLRFVVTSVDGGETLASLNQTLVAGSSYTLIFDSQNELVMLEE